MSEALMLVTYLGNEQLKRDFLAQIAEHERQDALIKGSYGQMNGIFRGCAIGCSLHSLNLLQGKTGPASAERTGEHMRYEAELGLPTWLAYLQDHVFEQLPLDQARTWPRRFAEAIPVGATFSDRVLARILWWGLASDEFGVRHATDDAEIRGHIDVIATMLDAESKDGATADQREAAARAARAAWAAWDARAAWAAWAAWDARAAWAAWDARAAWDAAQPSAARKKAPAFFPALSEFVLAQLRALPAR